MTEKGIAIIEAKEVEKFYKQPDGSRIQVIAPTNLKIYPNQILALLGPSGCGKSTLLRMLVGLEIPSAGEIYWHGHPIDHQKPNAAVVFQSFALFPWLTVLENVEAPLLARGINSVERHKRALKILDIVGLDGFEMAYPKELSGGMKQRVGFARALVVEPEVLFMDEPFSALDVLTAENLRKELLDLWLKRKIPTRTIFIVTHNIEEAVFLADRIVVLGKNPAYIRVDIDINLPRPRNRNSEEFIEMVDYIYKVLTKPDEELETEAYTIKEKKAKHIMLPHARPGGIAGLLEILSDRGGKDDLYHLADELMMEIDDLLPIVDAASLLGFVKVDEGDIELTLQGETFVKSDILERKKIFRESALENIPLLRQIESSLRTKSDRKLPEEFFLDILEEHFSEEEASRQLNTAIHWGRYAEIFDYDGQSQCLFLTEL
ncbi:MAG: nitrate/sulfonate/bicarbonate ABC transporter ATP-binding protein [Pyrinomonadaceae bacterium]|nr:nitrate/sulfonate/bicarbonate ABC transporter ATP-binding protein [Pyrinomonadaceae bacterium]MCX7640878.1 nitrate/sulfonate/bicarbonate ABC transporter ATP-binding protein [Pyrinomonadaceae bacterium]MDW8304682.1 nitrate/sulfonate/bicarbonate ABC transporter ATP-binding protein [Acidobacteriota bacterium]